METALSEFLTKISPIYNGTRYEIPLPKLSPRERLRRRLAFRNNIYVYNRSSSASGERIFSMFTEGVPFPVFENEVWWGDSWDGLAQGRAFDSARPFFQQFAELRDVSPHRARSSTRVENCDYCNNVNRLRDCYLVFNSAEVEDCMYGEKIPLCRDCVDCTECYRCELCYDCTACSSCFMLQSSLFCDGCNESYFLRNCRSCSHCFGCVNLRHREYCIFNQQYTKAEYETRLASLDLASYRNRLRLARECDEFFRKQPVPHIHAVFCEDVSGNCLNQCRNTADSYFVSETEDVHGGLGLYDGVKNCRDYSYFGNNAELVYESVQCGIGVFNLRFCYDCWENNSDLLYCWMCAGCKHCFGCVSLQKKEYCILNKQYTKEEYEALVPKIISCMVQSGEWGEFFPMSLSPHPYNRTVAQRYFPLSRAECEKQKLSWFEQDDQALRGARSVAEIPDEVPQADEQLVVSSIGSGRPFRITVEELRRYRKFKVPLPRLSYDERMDARMRTLGGLELFMRTCARTGREVLTSYGEELYPIVWERAVFEQEYN